MLRAPSIGEKGVSALRRPRGPVIFALPAPRADSGEAMHTASLLLSLLISSLGVGYFIYGKRRSHGASLLSGAAMTVYPIFVSNVWVMLGLGAMLAAMPFVFAF